MQSFEQVVEQFAGPLMGWAVKKTGSRREGEELAQAVLCEVFTGMTRRQVQNMEHFVWKVAHFVWCNTLRSKSSDIRLQSIEAVAVLADGSDIAAEVAQHTEDEAKLSSMRRVVANLSRMQREMLILHYLDGLSIAAVAARLNTSENAVKWHLFDSRNRIREGMDDMKEAASLVYRPGRLVLGITGQAGPDPDRKRVNDSLIRQNLCLLCYGKGKTLDDLVVCTGIPKPYLEFDLDWLVAREFLVLSKGRYVTTFPILGKEHLIEVGAIYQEIRKDYQDHIVKYLVRHMTAIRSIGFYGADMPDGRLLWSMLMLFTFTFSRSPLCLRLKAEMIPPIRPDGGRYLVVGNDLSDGQEIESGGYRIPELWQDFNGVHCCDLLDCGWEQAYWLGVYTFLQQPPAITNLNARQTALAWHRLLCRLIQPAFTVESLDGESKELLATAVEQELVIKRDGQFLPNFPIMTRGQLDRLRESIFQPLLDDITAQAEALSERFMTLNLKAMPKSARPSAAYITYLDLWRTGILSMLHAAEAGLLELPQTPHSGTALTLVLVTE